MMSNNLSGQPKSGNGRGSGSSSMKRKKINHSSEKPFTTDQKPLRGLGVAQLERIRLHGEMAMGDHPSFYHLPYYPPTYTNGKEEGLRVPTAAAYSSISSSPFTHSTPSTALHPTTAMMGRAKKFKNIQSSQDTRWSAGAGTGAGAGASASADTGADTEATTNIEGRSFTLPTLTTRHLLNLLEEESQQKKASIRSSSQNCGPSHDHEEIDLELRL